MGRVVKFLLQVSAWSLVPYPLLRPFPWTCPAMPATLHNPKCLVPTEAFLKNGVCVPCMSSGCPRRPGEALGPQELQLQAVVSYHVHAGMG